MKRKIRVYLRAFEPEDYVLLHKWHNDDEIGYFSSGTKIFASTLNEKRWVEEKISDKANVNLAICIKGTDEFIGCVALNTIDYLNRSGHCPTFIGEKEHWGKGYASDARILILKHAFYDKGLERIWAQVHLDNIGSLRMLEKCGFKQEGIMRKASYVNGSFKDMALLSILRDEFEQVLMQYEL
jgi:RimJ/RimL family protein N-acetyltransferase